MTFITRAWLKLTHVRGCLLKNYDLRFILPSYLPPQGQNSSLIDKYNKLEEEEREIKTKLIRFKTLITRETEEIEVTGFIVNYTRVYQNQGGWLAEDFKRVLKRQGFLIERSTASAI